MEQQVELELREQVRAFIAEQLERSIEEVTFEARIFYDLGVDSLTYLILIESIEEEYDIQIDEEKLRQRIEQLNTGGLIFGGSDIIVNDLVQPVVDAPTCQM